MDNIIKESRQKVNAMFIEYKNSQPVEISECYFVNDIKIATNSESLQNNLAVWNDVSKNKGMKLNKLKT